MIGFDPAWTGGDRHAMALRRGRKPISVESKTGLDTMAAAGWCKQVIDLHKPKRMFIDVGGVGAGVYDRLRAMGFGEIVRSVNFTAPFEPQPLDETGQPKGGPANRRAEMWMKSKGMARGARRCLAARLRHLQADACGPG